MFFDAVVVFAKKDSMDCLFCRIAKREIPADIVFENERVLAFRDIQPQAPVHLLIIPKRHIAGLNDITKADDQLLGEMLNVARELAKKEGVSTDGYRVAINCGANAGQAVAHLHYHVLGGRKFTWPPG